MRPHLVRLLCLSVWTGLASFAGGQEKTKDTPYYPLKVGTRWVYKSGGRTVTARVTKLEPVGDVSCARVEAGEGEDVQVEYVAARADGVFRYKVNNQDVDPPLCILKLPPKAGETWTISSRTGEREVKGTFTLGEAEVSVPAGKYKAVTVTCDDFEVGGERLGVTYWFVQGVGVVRQTVRVGGGEVVLELEKFQAGP